MTPPIKPSVFFQGSDASSFASRQSGRMDEKILAVPEDDPRDKEIRDLPDLAEHVPREIAAFFRTYKELQGVQTDVRDWSDAKAAWKIIEECRDRFEQHRFMTDDYAG